MSFDTCAAPRCFDFVRRQTLFAVTPLILASCTGMGEAMSAHTDVVARAEGKELRVEEAAEMLAANPQVPADPQVVRALTDLWVDYALLATAVAEDSTLAALDMASFIEPMREQALVAQLRNEVITADTVFDDAELERRWATEGPSAEVHARHILLRTPSDATDAQRDSVVQLAESLRQRALAGESFEELAQEYSQDPGSGARGGDLGYFSRGRMVEPFEEAAFALQPGEISEVVETPFGYHVIKVEERRQPELGDEREQFRRYLQQQAVQNAEREYLDELAAGANVEIVDGALDVVRELSQRPGTSLRERAAERPLVNYEGGVFTAGEFAEFMQEQPAQMQSAFATAQDEQIESGLEQLVQMELLQAEARSRGLTLSAEEEEDIRQNARQAVRQLLEGTGFAEAARAGATSAELDGMVKDLVQGVVAGERAFVPLGRLGTVLRNLYSVEINEASFPTVISQLEEIRASQPRAPAPAPGAAPGIAPGQVPGGAPGQPPVTPMPTPPPAGGAAPAPQTP